MIYVIGGNIGAGKSTLLKRLKIHFPDSLVIEEPLDQWGYLLKRMYDENLSNSETLFLFQSLVFAHYIQVTARLMEELERNPNQPIFVERCPAEALYVFLPLNRDRFATKDYEALVRMHSQVVQNDVWQKHARYVMLRVPTRTCMRRIELRARGGETSGITPDYLQRLEKHQRQDFFPKLPHKRLHLISAEGTANEVFNTTVQRIEWFMQHKDIAFQDVE